MEEPFSRPETDEQESQAVASSRRSLPLPLYPSWLTRVLIVFNVVMFGLLTFSSLPEQGLYESIVSGASTDALVFWGAKANIWIVQGEYWRLLTPIFLHIGVVHLLFNQYALFIFGSQVESLFGTTRFAAIYFLAGIAGNIASFAFSSALAAGASGSIFGIIGALAMFFVRNRTLLGEMGRQQFRSLLGMIGINLFLGFTLPGIDNFGHMGGLLTGLVLGAALAPTYLLQRLPEPPFARVAERASAVPMVLASLVAAGVLVLAATFAFQIAPLR